MDRCDFNVGTKEDGEFWGGQCWKVWKAFLEEVTLEMSLKRSLS